MLQNSRESGAINIDCVDPLGELNIYRCSWFLAKKNMFFFENVLGH